MYLYYMTEKIAIRTDAAPAPAHAFPQGVRKGPILAVSGQGPVDPATGEYLHPGDVRAQTRRTLENVAAILAERCTAGVPYPTRTTVVCTLPRAEMLVEIDALACID
jgi:2-iminobutanoate/2-iminopropanoate deaminase